jgi:uncharacterized repeat protein (TIGR01451 family)
LDSFFLAANPVTNDLFIRNISDVNWRKFKVTTALPLDVIRIDGETLMGFNGSETFESKSNGNKWVNLNQKSKFDVLVTNEGTVYGHEIIKPFNEKPFKFDNVKKSWSRDTSFPFYYTYFKTNDTLLLVQYDKLIGSKYPYTKWDTVIKFSNGEQPYNIRYYDNIIYFLIEGKGVTRYNTKGTRLSDLLNDGLSRLFFYADKNKIWSSPTGEDFLDFSNDGGRNWLKYNAPKNSVNFGSIRDEPNRFFLKVNNYLLVSSFRNGNTGGIYMSADDGKTWFNYNNGINLTPLDYRINLFKVDSFVFATSVSNMWRLNIKDIELKTLSGTVFIDKNKNGIKDTDEKGFPNAKVFLSNAGAFTTSDSLGNYAFLADLKATDTLKASIDSKYATYTPQYLLVSQSDTVKNIGVFIPSNLQDLVVNGTAITPPRSGFTNSYLLTYKNAGAITKSGKVTLAYNAKQTYIEATQAPTSNVNNTLSWDYANLQPNESRTLKVTFKTAADVPIRTQLTNVATIEPIATDTFKTDNVDSLYQTVVGSYDPNDKQVSFLNTRQTPSVIDPNTELTYTIRFQNTGNYQADFVRVTDTLSDKLDLTSLRVLATSHNYTLSVKNKNVLQFEFNPIYLPDSTTNEKESHGFIKFAIKPKKTLTKDEVIKNTAYIFFDYNPAIITNTVETANQKVNGLFTPSVLESLSVFPNPTNGEISFSLDKYQGKALSINVYSIDGKLMMNKHTVGEAVNRINGESLRNGLYVLQVRVGDDIVFGKFLVQK